MDKEYTTTLHVLITKIDGLAASADRREELLTKINGYVRDHGEQLAANKQWIWGHKQTHDDLETNIHTLSNRLFLLSGGTGILSIVATILQFVKL